jgi:hypothetical protein
MTRFAVRTLTLNPSIDVSIDTEKVAPTRKVLIRRLRAF